MKRLEEPERGQVVAMDLVVTPVVDRGDPPADAALLEGEEERHLRVFEERMATGVEARALRAPERRDPVRVIAVPDVREFVERPKIAHGANRLDLDHSTSTRDAAHLRVWHRLIPVESRLNLSGPIGPDDPVVHGDSAIEHEPEEHARQRPVVVEPVVELGRDFRERAAASTTGSSSSRDARWGTPC